MISTTLAAARVAAQRLSWRAATVTASTTRALATERDLGAQRTARPENPLAGENVPGKHGGFDTELEDKMKKYSGIEDDVHVKDAAEGGLNKMAADPSGVEAEYKERAVEAAENAWESTPRQN